MSKKIFAVDFDGFLVEDKWPEVGAPIQRNIDLVKGLKSEGHKIILWTCRKGKQLSEAVQTMGFYHDVKFDAVNENLPEIIEKYKGDSRKITADFYLDDRSMTYEQAKIILDTGMTEAEFNSQHRSVL